MIKLLQTIKHAIAVFVGFFRRPGRFSVFHYSRNKALERLQTASKGRVLDIGCGSRKLSPRVISLDLYPGPYVDLVADASRLPFADGECDAVWMDALLEHVPDPERILNEASRVLKDTGWIYCEVPFLQGEHSAPGDYRRWTRQGLLQLFEGWDLEWIESSSGPFSALAYQLRSCLSLLTCFGSDLLYRIMFEAVWSYVVWPIKLLDACVRCDPRAAAHAFGYAIMVRKKTRK